MDCSKNWVKHGFNQMEIICFTKGGLLPSLRGKVYSVASGFANIKHL